MFTFIILEGIEALVGYIWFDSYEVKAYETAIDHFLILKIFLLIKILFAFSFIGFYSLQLIPRKFWTAEILTLIFLFPLAYFLGFMKYKSDHVYEYLKSSYTIYEGRFFEYDSILGKRAIKNAVGYQDYWMKAGTDYKKRIIIDSNGFRVAEKKYPIVDSSLMFFLGCSFTWGDGCIAEQTYPYVLSSKLSRPYLNAGQSAYGLAQMTLLAEKLIPEMHPKYVFVQYSPWLIQRSLSPFKATVFFADIAFPYVDTKDGKLEINHPVIRSGLLSFDSEYYRRSPSSLSDRLSFYYDYGVKVLAHDYLLRLLFEIKQIRAKDKAPATQDGAELYLYKRIFDIAHQYGCKIYVVKISGVKDEAPLTKGLFDGEPVIDADSALRSLAGGDQKKYGQLFYHWVVKDRDSVLVDVHPNPFAHSVIAKEILNKIDQ